MARPRSEDKRNAILAAAIAVIAEQGTGAPTARIAKLAGVAEGTLFTYFATKDDLLNQLYLDIKAELREVMMADYPAADSLKTRCRHVWVQYLAWSRAQSDKRKAMAQLSVSDRITEATKATGMQAFADIDALLVGIVALGILRDHPPAFAAGILMALAETTLDFIAREPAEAERYTASGFESFWRAVASG